MRVAVVAHHSRRKMAEALCERVGADSLIVDTESRGSLWGHRQALAVAEAVEVNGERTWILEDDAVAPADFRERAEAVGEQCPGILVSGYLGRLRPPQYQAEIKTRLGHPAARRDGVIMLPQLIHGVCYSVPVGDVARVVRSMRPGPADFSVGDAWGGRVAYCVPSLVDHADGPSVEKHPDKQPRAKGRTAWVPPEGI